MASAPEFNLGRFRLWANFDSGNLAHAELGDVGSNDIRVFTRCDGYGTEFATENRSWFYFAVSGGARGTIVRITVMNLNMQAKLYADDFRPVFRVDSGDKRGKWKHLAHSVAYRSTEDHQFEVRTAVG